MRLIAFVLAIAMGLPTPSALARGEDEAGTLKGARGAPQPATSGAPKAKPGKGSGLMEDEGIYYKDKPAPAGKPKSR
jgi:hypothetical protein